MPILLRDIISKFLESHPEYSQNELARRIGINKASLSILLNHGKYPRRYAIEGFQRSICEKLAGLGMRILEPPEANFEGAENSQDGRPKYPLAKWLCWEAKITQQQIAYECGISQGCVAYYLFGRMPINKKSMPLVEFQDVILRILGRFFSPRVLEDIYKPMSAEEFREFRGKIKEEEKGKMLTQEVLKSFGWSRNPFAVDEALKPDEIFLSEEHREILDQLLQAAQTRRFFVMYGQTGIGKTMILKKAKEYLRRISIDNKDDILSINILEEMQRVPREERAYLIIEPAKEMAQEIDARNILNQILAGLEIGENLNQDLMKKAMLLKTALIERKQKVILVIDEGNRLRADTLRSLKAFFELEDDETFERLLSIIVIGQPIGLEDKMNFLESLKEINLRAVQKNLLPYKDGQAEAFIASRCAMIGKLPSDIFTVDAIKEIIDRAKRYGGQTPAMLNRLIINSLLNKYNLNPNAVLVGIDEVIG